MEGVLIKVAAFVAIIVAGYCTGRSNSFGKRPGEVVSKIVFTFTLPCSVVHAFGSAQFTPQLLVLVPIGLACAFVPYVVAAIVSRRCERGDRVFYMLNICGFNIGCFALPYVQALFSPEMAVAVCMFDAGNAMMMTGGAYALTGLIAGTGKGPIEQPLKFVVRRLFSSLPFDAYLILIVLAVFDIKIPQQVVAFTAAHCECERVLRHAHAGSYDWLYVGGREAQEGCNYSWGACAVFNRVLHANPRVLAV